MDFTHSQTSPYSPLTMYYSSLDQQRKWTLDFQLRPEPKIIFNGDDPTTEELIECLKHTNAPMWMLEICRVAIGVGKP